MRAAAQVLHKLKAFVWNEESDQLLTYFQEQEQVSESIEASKKSLQYVIDMSGFSITYSLKKLHRFLHPALKFIQFCKHMNKIHGLNNSDNQNYIAMHEEELISSAIAILQMYCLYLSTVVPANISYFHFMREKDLYVHYTAIRYILEVGQISSLFRSSTKSFDIFHRLSTEARIMYIRFISHWTYDMVKYKCSALYLSTSTMPYLILVNMVLLCGLFDFDGANILDEFKRNREEEKETVYQHFMYVLTYVLSQSHFNKSFESSQGNGYIQIVLLATCKLLKARQKSYEGRAEKEKRKKTIFAPSYWFAESIGFIKNPELETISFLLILDMIDKKKNFPISSEIQAKENKSLKDNYNAFQDEEIQSERSSEHSHQGATTEEINLSEKSNEMRDSAIQAANHTYDNFNNLTTIIMYHCIKIILEELPDLGKIKKLQETLKIEIETLPLDSFIRPYVLSILDFLKSNTFCVSEKEIPEEDPQNDVREKVEIFPTLNQYFEKSQIDYSTEKYIISYQTVGKNCSTFINKLYPKILENCNKQVERTDGQIWGQILKHNIHEFMAKNN